MLEVVFIQGTICLTQRPLLSSSGVSYASHKTDFRNKEMVSELKKKKKNGEGRKGDIFL